jgi:hypothetical protein
VSFQSGDGDPVRAYIDGLVVERLLEQAWEARRLIGENPMARGEVPDAVAGA